MIRKLQRQFVLTASAAVFIILVFLLGLINRMNYTTVSSSCYTVLDYLAENDGDLPPGFRAEQAGIRNSMGDEAPYRLRYLSVHLDADGGVCGISTDHISAVGPEEAEEYAEKLAASGQKRGIYREDYNTYFYRVTDTESGGKLVCILDATNALWHVWEFAELSVGLGFLTLLMFMIVMTVLSRRAIEPFVKNMESQKRFITNAGHELKTPIAVISANAEVLEMMNGESEWTTSILNQSKRLTGLVNDLILLSKTQEAARPELSEQNLSAAAADAVNAFRTVAEQQGKRLTAEIAPDVKVMATERELPALVNILTDNAVKYCDDGGTVRLSLSRKPNGKGAVLTAENDYAAGKDLDCSRFFDRFYRADESHNSKKTGYGIGLSMAEGITGMYRGKIRADWKDGVIRFTVTLP